MYLGNQTPNVALLQGAGVSVAGPSWQAGFPPKRCSSFICMHTKHLQASRNLLKGKDKSLLKPVEHPVNPNEIYLVIMFS